jgi:Dolichyl-phosphate-mannose-protein mannosyltransferase
MGQVTVPDEAQNTSASKPVPLLQRPALTTVALALLIGIGLIRIVSTYHVFNHTIDEGAHLACGIQWFQNVYTYDQKHTPIARISIALLPYLDGLRGYGNPSYWQEGVLLLSTGGRYWHNLTLARIGVLPYFVLATIVTFLWTRRTYGNTTALVGAIIFTTLPVVLAHSALATTDIPLAAFFVAAVYAFTRWLSSPNWRTASVFGITTGLAISTKLSTVAFLPPTMVGVLVLCFVTERRNPFGSNPDQHRFFLRNAIRSAVIAAVCMFFIIWGAYRFSHAPINKFSPVPDRIATKVFGQSSSITRAIHALNAEVHLPVPELYSGLRELRNINNALPRSYMFGRVKHGGWWYFYPVGIVVKTPLPVILLAFLGAIILITDWWRRRVGWQEIVPVLAIIAILVVAAPTKLDIGVRHVMPVFAFLSMLAAVGAVKLWNWPPWHPQTQTRGSRLGLWAGPTASLILLIWLFISSARAHPDYLSYFNELGGKNPEHILLISDFDWGQDLTRLASYLQDHKIDRINIGYSGLYDPKALGLPETQDLNCDSRPVGWVAMEMRRARLSPECFPWLQPLRPIATVGKTMQLYYIAQAQGASVGQASVPEESTPNPAVRSQPTE